MSHARCVALRTDRHDPADRQNRVPDDLYHHGVQKERMAGFLDSLKARCEVVELDGGKDWRGGVDGEERSGIKWFQDDQDAFDAEWERSTRDTKSTSANRNRADVYSRQSDRAISGCMAGDCTCHWRVTPRAG